jgi:hypothetical protein
MTLQNLLAGAQGSEFQGHLRCMSDLSQTDGKQLPEFEMPSLSGEANEDLYTNETIAESAAFVIGAHFGFNAGVRSFPYAALWSQDKKVLEENLAAIRKVTARSSIRHQKIQKSLFWC